MTFRYAWQRDFHQQLVISPQASLIERHTEDWSKRCTSMQMQQGTDVGA